MLILTEKQISHCMVAMEGSEILGSGIEFNKRIYAATTYEFPLKNMKQALMQCRILLDQGVFCLVVQESHKISLWIQRADLRRADPPVATKPLSYRGSPLRPQGSEPRTRIQQLTMSDTTPQPFEQPEPVVRYRA